MSADLTSVPTSTAAIKKKLEIFETIMKNPETSESVAIAEMLTAENLSDAHDSPVYPKLPELLMPPRQSTDSTPSATSETEDEAAEAAEATVKEIRMEEVNLEEEIPESEDHGSESDGDSGAPATFASHIFFQKGLEGGNSVNFTVTRRKDRKYIQVGQAEDEAVPLSFFRNCLDHVTGVQDETETLEQERQKSFDDLALGSCLTGAGIGMVLLLWFWYIIAGAVQVHARKC